MDQKVNISCSELKIPYYQLKELVSSGLVQLGIDNSVAIQISTNRGLQPSNWAVTGALHLWNWVAVIVIGGSIYLSFTSAWWWFIPGIILSGIIVKSNKKGNTQNLLDAGLTEVIFYTKILSINGWIYRIDASNVDKVKQMIGNTQS